MTRDNGYEDVVMESDMWVEQGNPIYWPCVSRQGRRAESKKRDAMRIDETGGKNWFDVSSRYCVRVDPEALAVFGD